MSAYAFNRQTLDAACARAAVPPALRCDVPLWQQLSRSAYALIVAGLASTEESALSGGLIVVGLALMVSVIVAQEVADRRGRA